jgi:BirA family biotin operon repressor/biotin-[acetyl-CoA-carboxylase] ligase
MGIYATLILRPATLTIDQVPLLSLLAAVATAEAIAQTTPTLAPMIKWPNDILVNGNKVAGILAQLSNDQPHTPCVLIGIGINVNTPTDQLPTRPLYPASSLKAEVGYALSRRALLAACLERIEHWLDLIERSNTGALLDRWQSLACIDENPITIKQQNGTVSGRVQGIAADGSLMLKTGDNNVIRILSGDVMA